MRVPRRLFALILLLALSGCPSQPTRPDAGAEEFGVTILSINLRDILNHPESATGLTWRERYARIGPFIAAAPVKPDFIVLQEAAGYWNCPTDTRRMPDYASIDFLLDDIRDATGEQYRIAYLITDKEGRSLGHAWMGSQLSGGCYVRGGNALLYRPSRVRNVLASVGDAFPYDNMTNTGSHALNSMPCCFPAADRSDVCALIDGPPQVTPRCATPSPSGAAWTQRHLGRDSEMVTSAAFDRFELVQQPGNFIHLYNVHLVPDRNWDPSLAVASINRLVDDMEARFDPRGTDRLYPPIMVGDFNIDEAGIRHNMPPGPIDPNNPRAPFFPRFDIAFWSPSNPAPIPSGVTGMLIGKPSVFRSKQTPHVKFEQAPPGNMCENNGGDVATLWSDHCAIYLRIQPSP